MTRRDAAVLVLVSAGLYFVLVSLSYLSGLVGLFDPPVSFPPGWNPAVYFASYLVPFGVLLAAGQLLIRGRHALAQEIFPEDAPLPPLEGHVGQARVLGSVAFTVLGLLALLLAVDQLPAVIQVLQPYSWHSAGIVRVVLVSVFHPVLLAAYIVLGWYLVARRKSLVERWLIAGERPQERDDSQRIGFETVIFRVVGLCFVMVALVPLRQRPREPDCPWPSKRDRERVGLLAGRGQGHPPATIWPRCLPREEWLAAAWQRIAGSRTL